MDSSSQRYGLGHPRPVSPKLALHSPLLFVKAYRKLAAEWHPDKFQTEEEKKVAEKKFMDLADAKEVLTDPDKRAIFDNGEDPLDAESNQERQQRQQGHQFFRGFGGGGQHFHFRHG